MCCTSPCGENDIYYLLRVTGALVVFHLTMVHIFFGDVKECKPITIFLLERVLKAL